MGNCFSGGGHGHHAVGGTSSVPDNGDLNDAVDHFFKTRGFNNDLVNQIEVVNNDGGVRVPRVVKTVDNNGGVRVSMVVVNRDGGGVGDLGGMRDERDDTVSVYSVCLGVRWKVWND